MPSPTVSRRGFISREENLDQLREIDVQNTSYGTKPLSPPALDQDFTRTRLMEIISIGSGSISSLAVSLNTVVSPNFQYTIEHLLRLVLQLVTEPFFAPLMILNPKPLKALQ